MANDDTTQMEEETPEAADGLGAAQIDDLRPEDAGAEATDGQPVAADASDEGGVSEENTQVDGVENDPEEPRGTTGRPEDIAYTDAAQGVEELFARMHPRRRILKKIISFCKQTRTDSELMEAVRGFMANDYTVYPPETLCHIMSRYAVLHYEPPYDEEYEQTEEALMENASQMEVDDVSIACASALPAGGERGQGMWTSAPEALAYVARVSNLDGFYALMDKDAAIADAYAELLRYCSKRKRSKMDIDEKIDPLPVLKNPRVFAGHLVSGLEQCECIEWQGGWATTDLGKQALEWLEQRGDEQ